MERLQEAITKAREKQGGTSRATGGFPREDTALSLELWEALPGVALTQSVLEENRIVTLDSVAEATAFDMLRTRTLRMMQDKGWRRLAITSPTASCGKSTVSLNLAFSLARQPNTRAVEIELDMRRPSQNRLLGLGGENTRCRSVGDLLSGRSHFGDLAVRYGENLALVTNDYPAPNASDILLNESVGAILDQVEAEYQPNIMCFDMPPVLVNDDAMAFMKHVDCVLIVAAAGQSTIEEIDRCESDLATQTNVLGVVLNKCEFSQSGYGSYGY